MTLSCCFCKLGVWQTWFGDPLKGFGVGTSGRFRDDPVKNYMAVSVDWVSVLVCGPYNESRAIWGLYSGP